MSRGRVEPATFQLCLQQTCSGVCIGVWIIDFRMGDILYINVPL
jgi:hypothetical protein